MSLGQPTVAAKKRSLGFEGGVGGKNKVLAKEAVAAMAYSGDAMHGTPHGCYARPLSAADEFPDPLGQPIARRPMDVHHVSGFEQLVTRAFRLDAIMSKSELG